MNSDSNQIVYVLTNPAMPGLIKIGMTTQLEVDARLRQLYSTGVPVPFDCAFACKVKDALEVERALHYAFGKDRINPNREFFRIEADRVIAVLRLLQVEDITDAVEQTIDADTDAADRQSAEVMKEARRPRMNFHELGIPTGSVLFSKDGTKKAIVSNEKKVIFEGQECSLSAATRVVLGLPKDYAIQPSPHWTFNGKSLHEIYDETHSGQE